MNRLKTLTRRRLLGAGAAGLAAPVVLPLFAQLANAATVSDYKALVCVNFDGGNDQHNTVVPYGATAADDHYTRLYEGVGTRGPFRPNAKPVYANLKPINPVTPQRFQKAVALHAQLGQLQTLFNDDAGRRLAVLAGVGVLEQPTTRADLESRRYGFPNSFGSHNDSSAAFLSLGGEGDRNYGWGGLMLDALSSGTVSPFASIAITNFNGFGAGRRTDQFVVNEEGVILGLAGQLGGNADFDAFFGARGREALTGILRGSSSNVLEKDYVRLTSAFLETASAMKAALDASVNACTYEFLGDPNADRTRIRDNSLLKQLRTVARLISQRSQLGLSTGRQIFFVSLGGFDFHGGLVSSQEGRLAAVDTALYYFDRILGDLGLRNQVTTFTTSEFGRQIFANSSDGTDHGWAGHQFILGGAVKGRDIYGQLPAIDRDSLQFSLINGSLDHIPDISLEMYGATLGQWFGVSRADLETIFPRLNRFYADTAAAHAAGYVGFMRT